MEALMDRKPRTLRAALAGTTVAFCFASTLLLGACAVKSESFDFPAMRLTSAPDAAAGDQR
jgi:hypothetical protein